MFGDLLKIVCAYLSREECSPFLAPVQWKELGLMDYLEVVKKPMDLGTIKRKLENHEYKDPVEAVADIRLVWSNCMAYNQDGSDFYHLADRLSRDFESKYAELVNKEDDPCRIPNVDERIKLSYEFFRIDNAELGKVLTIIEQVCPIALNRRSSEDEVMINIDMLSPMCFLEINNFLASSSSKYKKRKSM